MRTSITFTVPTVDIDQGMCVPVLSSHGNVLCRLACIPLVVGNTGVMFGAAVEMDSRLSFSCVRTALTVCFRWCWLGGGGTYSTVQYACSQVNNLESHMCHHNVFFFLLLLGRRHVQLASSSYVGYVVASVL